MVCLPKDDSLIQSDRLRSRSPHEVLNFATILGGTAPNDRFYEIDSEAFGCP
jgi:hypothetical protein